MLKRDGEDPHTVAIATHPTHSELVANAIEQIQYVCTQILPVDQIFLILEEEIELSTGKIAEMNNNAILLSLEYPTAKGRIYEIVLGAPSTASLH